MGYDKAKELWQTEEALIYLKRKVNTKTQKVTFIEKCIVITKTVIAYISADGMVENGELTSIVNVRMHHAPQIS